MKPFRFGVINEQMKPPVDWIAHVKRAETLGYATFLIRDHYVSDFFGDQYAPIAAMTVAACMTTHLRVGTLVIDNDYRHPVLLAKEIATLDQLSGGRVEFGLGAGWLKTEYEQAGIQYDPNGVRVSRLEEALAVYKALFAGESVTHKGEFYAIDHIQNVPMPQQRPHPPILIGAGQKRMLGIAGREADIVGLLTTSVSSGTLSPDPTERLAETIHQKIEWIKEGAGSRFDQLELSLIPSLNFTQNRRERAQQLITESGWTDITIEQVLAMPSVFIGTVDEIAADMVARREQYGFSYFVISDELMEVAAPLVAKLRGV